MFKLNLNRMPRGGSEQTKGKQRELLTRCLHTRLLLPVHFNYNVPCSYPFKHITSQDLFRLSTVT